MRQSRGCRRRWLATALVGLISGTWGLAGAQELPTSVAQVLSEQDIRPGAVSIAVATADSRSDRLSIDPDTPRNPASTIKLLTTLVGLETLGPEYTWPTEVYADGPVHQGRLHGDLILKGYGDPFLVTESFWKLLRAIYDRGVRQIAGNLVLDRSYFAPTPGKPGDFDGEAARAYNALPDALALNFQSTVLELVPEPEAGKVRLIASPPQANLELDNRLRLVQGPCSWRHWRPEIDLSGQGLQTLAVVRGDYSVHCEVAALPRLLATPDALIDGVFRSLWRELGGELEGRLSMASTPPDADLVYRAESRPLAELIRGMNKFSNNLMTRQLFLTLGAERFGAPASEDKGRRAMAEWLAKHELNVQGLSVVNGAGLSRETRITARDLASILAVGARSEFAPEFLASLPIAATDGTMRKRLEGEPIARQARIKTGSLDDVSSMAGYVRARSGRQYLVVMLINQQGLQAWQGKLAQDALLRWVYDD